MRQYEQRVEQHVDDPARRDAHRRGEGAPVRADEVGEDGVEDGERAAHGDDPAGIAAGEGVCLVRCAAQAQNRRGEQRKQHAERRAREQCEPEAHRTDLPRAVTVAAAEELGDAPRAAHGEEVRERRHQKRHRVRQRHRRRLRRVVEQADEIGVREVIQQDHHLARDRGDDLPPDGLPHGHPLKEIRPVDLLSHRLPEPQNVLHQQAHARNADPAAKSQCKRLTTRFD